MSNEKQIDIPLQFITKRLVIRTFSAVDAPQLHSALVESITELREHLWFLPWVAEKQTLLSAEKRCHVAKNNFKKRTDLAYLVFEKMSGHLVGSVGLHRTDWSIPTTEVGFWVRTSETGKGYATECVNELTFWALQGLLASRVELVTGESNKGSRVVAERCGFHLDHSRQDDVVAPDQEIKNLCVYVKLPNTVKANRDNSA